MARDPENDDLLDFEGHVEQQTDLAVLFYVELTGDEIWFPLSVSKLVDDDTIIRIPRWLAKKEDLL